MIKAEILNETQNLMLVNSGKERVLRGFYNDMKKNLDAILAEIAQFPPGYKEDVLLTLSQIFDFEAPRMRRMSRINKKEDRNINDVDLYELTKKWTTNDDLPFIHTAIRAKFLDLAENGITPVLIPRETNIPELKGLSVYINCYAQDLLDEWFMGD